MPRYYRRRYTRVVRPKKKWASNIKVWENQSVGTSYGITLVSNDVQTGTPTPSILKVGNFKVSLDCACVTTEPIEFNPACTCYILYVPEGWAFEPQGFRDLIVKHPEWIMATKTMGGNLSASAQSRFSVDTLNMSTKLKRNLNSGDRVAIYFNFSVVTGVEIRVSGNVRYWTCSN